MTHQNLVKGELHRWRHTATFKPTICKRSQHALLHLDQQMCFKYLHFQMPTFIWMCSEMLKFLLIVVSRCFLESKGRQTWVAALVSLNGCLLFTFHLIFSSLSSTSRYRKESERESSIEARVALLLSEIDEQIPRLINVVCRASRAAGSGCLLNQPRTPRSSHLDKRCLYGKPNKSKSHIQRLIYWPLTLRAKSSSTFMWILLNALFLLLL